MNKKKNKSNTGKSYSYQKCNNINSSSFVDDMKKKFNIESMVDMVISKLNVLTHLRR